MLLKDIKEGQIFAMFMNGKTQQHKDVNSLQIKVYVLTE